jgi:membrane protein implicated in regulation of membrane protease activity
VADTPPREQISELKDLLIAYFKQETIDPLKGLARYVGFGLLGALLIGTGICFLAIGGLRALQTETGTTFEGHWSWAPYGITVAGLVIIAVAAVLTARSPRSSR